MVAPTPRRRSIAAAAVVGLGLLAPSLVFSQKAPASSSAPGAPSAPLVSSSGSASAAPAPLPEQEKARHIWGLIAEALDPSVEPASLFGVSLEDEGAIQLAAARTRAFLREIDQAAEPEPRASASAAASAAPASSFPAVGVDAGRFAALLELERAQLAFYGRPREEREMLLVAHRERQRKADLRASKESEQDRRVREVEEGRQRALAAAAAARSEAERLVSEELARLLGLEKALVSQRQRFTEEEGGIRARRDALLGWQRRAREAQEKGAEAADPMYEELRQALQRTQTQMRDALGALSSESSRVPALGGNPLKNLKVDVATEKAQAKRREVEGLAASLREQEQRLQNERAAALLEELDTLNAERLRLLASLSPERRAAVTGFSAQGWEQARSEARHLALIGRYHQHVTAEWLSRLRNQEDSLEENAGHALLVGIPWLLLLGVYTWWRRSSSKTILALRERLKHEERFPRASSKLLLLGLRLGLAVHRPVELSLLFAGMVWLLPQSARELLEVQLLSVSVGWILASAFVVNATNALFAARKGKTRQQQEADDLRMRSLLMVRRVVVAFALVLVLSSRLVGEGTIYRWVLVAFWAAVFPLFLLLVRWWRGELFARVEHERKKSAVHRWILANQRGWASFPAALLAAGYVIVTVGLRLARLWLNGFNLARRAHAYLFRRELDKLERERSAARLRPLPDPILDALGPDRPSEQWIPGGFGEHLEQLDLRRRERRGGVIALVGARGMGKTRALAQLRQAHPDALAFSCEGLDLAGLRARMASALGVKEDSPLQALGAALDQDDEARPVLLDDVQGLIRTVMGGLQGFDRLVNLARGHSKHALWVLAIDEVVWSFLSRARSIYPLFDEVIFLEPWREEQIAELLASRSEQAGIEPSFDGLLEQLPPGSDEQDRADALQERKGGYFRLVWDHAGGNPGVALQVWRCSLAQDEAGAPLVRLLQAPEVEDLERLPDGVLFVLRAILQLAPASPLQIEAATRLEGRTLHDALRYGLARGYLVEEQGRFRVTWAWYQPIVQLLQRRQLLVKR
jgi:hypothetical protein